MTQGAFDHEQARSGVHPSCQVALEFGHRNTSSLLGTPFGISGPVEALVVSFPIPTQDQAVFKESILTLPPKPQLSLGRKGASHSPQGRGKDDGEREEDGGIAKL